MNSLHASRIVCIAACLATVAVMIWAMGPFGQHAESGDMMLSLIMMPILAIWAVGPYAVANKFARDEAGQGAWLFVVLQIITGFAVMWLYIDGLIVTPEPGAKGPLVFAIVPIYQFVAVLAAYYGLRLWRRIRSAG